MTPLFADDTTTILGLLGILATGISGLLGLVVKWLLSHITDLTRQSMEAGLQRDKTIAEIQKDFKESLRLVVEHCERETTRQIELQKERDAKFEIILDRHIRALEGLKDVVAGLHAKLLSSD